MNPIVELITKLGDDAFILGHRHSEWTGLGPILEEDIAMSSMAQDKIGHALALYTILHEQFGGPDPDTIGFLRNEKEFRCCHLVEYPNGEYDFTLVRHFLFDHAELLRYQLLRQSTFAPLARFAAKVMGELKYHVLHADSLMQRLALGNEESHARLQASLTEAFPLAAGIFEKSPYEDQLIAEGVFAGEALLQQQWLKEIEQRVQAWDLHLPEAREPLAGLGGRYGYHTPYLQPLLDELTSVFRSEENASW
ncbi:MAG: phenylacetate-CoA oxygenase subunit PaaC [Chitinophagales bacterium]|nr:phenylacetate-CoA oxygenase subunit PaaC [Chitinophagales bacterium]MDW8427179.1 1,2-phenylacetyl-CoA epoxidase subunit PaaC [Chitinophagales bacterium]